MFRVINDVFFQGNLTAKKEDLTGKHIVLTGPSIGGIGFETAAALADFGASVTVGSRSLPKGEAAALAIKERFPDALAVKVLQCDTSDLTSVRAFAEAVVKPVDVIVCNAGSNSNTCRQVECGVEYTFAACALGHHLLAQLLTPKRVVWITGDIYVMANGPADPFFKYKDGYMGGSEAYSRACVARMLLGWELQKRFLGKIDVVMVHPGVVDTNLMADQIKGGPAKWTMSKVLIGARKGAQASILAASIPSEDLPAGSGVEEGIEGSGLRYMHNKKGWMELKASDKAMDASAAKALFDQCNEICGL